MAREVALLAGLCLLGVDGKKVLNCGSGVQLCGVLALESGFGPHAYEHTDPVVHGLWPQTKPYGTSKCVAPKENRMTKEKHHCFAPAGKKQAWFENHEWTKHGVCAGAQNDDDFFDQVCKLSKEPLELMNKIRDERIQPCVQQTTEPQQETCFLKIIKEIEKTFPVWSVDQYNDQIMLSACAGRDGHWKLARVEDFPRVCSWSGGGGSPRPTSRPKPTRRPSSHPSGSGKAVCAPQKRGPRCRSDSDCTGKSGCLRCAKSGKCTYQPLSNLRLSEELPADADLLPAGSGTSYLQDAASKVRDTVTSTHPGFFVACVGSFAALGLIVLKVRSNLWSRRLALEEAHGEFFKPVE